MKKILVILLLAVCSIATAQNRPYNQPYVVTRTSLGLDNLTAPLMSYGGYKFDGSTNYLDTNALTGIADGKKGTIVALVRFANASSASEQIMNITGNRLVFVRTSGGNIQVTALNSSLVSILSQITTNTPCSAAGTYLIEVSWDLATAGSFKLYINDVSQPVTSTTFTDDTIDYTSTEFSIGATATGGNKLTGDIYTIWFDPTSNIDFSVIANRRLFASVANVPVFLGKRGELPTGTAPILFLGYSSYLTWPSNRGTATSTSFTENGTPAAVTTTMYGQYADTVMYQGGRVTTGSITAGATALVTLTWTTAFRDTLYTATCTVQDSTTSSASLSVVHIDSVAAASVAVRVLNGAVGSLTGTLHCIGIHD